MSGLGKILIAEDDELVRRYLMQLLEKNSWSATAVQSGSDAFASIRTTRFDVVLCDLHLGAGLNGIEVLHRTVTANIHIPFVILTAYGTVDRCRQAFELGASNFLEKPTSERILLSALRSAAGVTKAAMQVAEPAGSDWHQRIGDDHVRRAIRLVEQRSDDPDFSVEILAKALAMGPDHLARLFRTHLGRKPLEVIHQARIRRSEGLLANPEVSIYEVAFDCGYRSTTEFDRWFRRLRHMTPSEWREQWSRRS